MRSKTLLLSISFALLSCGSGDYDGEPSVSWIAGEYRLAGFERLYSNSTYFDETDSAASGSLIIKSDGAYSWLKTIGSKKTKSTGTIVSFAKDSSVSNLDCYKATFIDSTFASIVATPQICKKNSDLTLKYSEPAEKDSPAYIQTEYWKLGAATASLVGNYELYDLELLTDGVYYTNLEDAGWNLASLKILQDGSWGMAIVYADNTKDSYGGNVNDGIYKFSKEYGTLITEYKYSGYSEKLYWRQVN
ncbi:hypothetical protein AGMMS49938_18440 [Fibrobacterales bacterium]|nr:hypothetical protein AGMMS49938_18440 [Fibrobacterales bacterium]